MLSGLLSGSECPVQCPPSVLLGLWPLSLSTSSFFHRRSFSQYIWPKRPFCYLKLCRYYLLFLVKAILSSYRGKGDLLNHSIPKSQNFMMQFLLAYRVASVEWTHSQGIPPLFLLCRNMFIFHIFMSDKRRQEKTMMNGRWLVQIFQGCLPCQMLIEALKLGCEWELC